MEELIGDVRENGGATRRDAALGHQNEQTRQELAKVHEGKSGEIGKEICGEVGGVIRGGWRDGGNGAEAEMMSAKTGLRFRAEAATLAIGETMQTAGGFALEEC
jgi:hypothetical protein